MAEGNPFNYLGTPEADFDVDSFIAEHGLSDIANERIEAHGGVYDVRTALAECPPFANMMKSLVGSLAEVPNKEEIIKDSVRSMAQGANSELPAPKKK